jgi:uncharacterized protein (TIGR03435 family)
MLRFFRIVHPRNTKYSANSDSFLRFVPELGLKLERGKGPVEVFVIDHAARPSPN